MNSNGSRASWSILHVGLPVILTALTAFVSVKVALAVTVSEVSHISREVARVTVAVDGLMEKYNRLDKRVALLQQLHDLQDKGKEGKGGAN